MGKQFSALEPAHRKVILEARIFFTASAAATGRINLSPRSTDTLRVVDENTVAYLDLTGSGNETAAHILADGRLTIMFCTFAGPPAIVRLYGRGRTLARPSAEYTAMLAATFNAEEPLGARQIVVLNIELVQTSCGYGVPLLDYRGERTTLARWAEGKGEAGLALYRREKNARSIDGFSTGLCEPDEPSSQVSESFSADVT